MHIPDFDAGVLEILRQILRHPLGQGGDQDPFFLSGAGVDFSHQVVDLAGDGTDFHPGVQQSGGADDLFHHLVCPFPLVWPGGCGDKDRLTDTPLEFLELQGPVVVSAGQPEAVFHQTVLPRMVAVIHGPDLWQGNVAFVHKEQEIVGEEVQQGHWRGALGTVGDYAGIVLNAGAVAQFCHHFHIVLGPLTDTLCLHKLLVVGKRLHLLFHFLSDLVNGLVHLDLGGDVMAGGINGDMIQHPVDSAGDGVEIADPLDLVAKELHPHGMVLVIGRVELHGIPADPKHIAFKGDIVALISDLHQSPQKLVPVPLRAGPEGNDHVGEIIRLAQTVDAGDGGNHDHVPAFQKGAGGGEAEAVNFVVGGCVFSDIGVRVGNIGLGLIVVVIGDKILHGVIWKKLLEFGAELSGKGLVMSQNQSGTLDGFNHLGHGKGLARASNAQQHLLFQPIFDALRQRLNCFRLVPGGLIFRYNLKFRHERTSHTRRFNHCTTTPGEKQRVFQISL